MKYIIDGSFLYGHIKGVQRYARQITKELDKYMADKPYEVEIAVPEIDSEGTSAEINSYKTHYNGWKIWKNVGTVHVSEICGQAEG